MEAHARRMSLLRKLAWATLVLVLAITSLSALIRLSRAGLGCEPWPQCHVQRAGVAGEILEARDASLVTAARLAHRVAASAALVLLVALLMLALARQPALWPQGRLVLALLALALLLAGLGRVGGVSRAPVVVLGNLLGGLAMVAVAWRLVLATQPQHAGVPALRGWTWGAIALLAAQLALGALVSANQWASQCGAVFACQAHRGGGVLLAGLLALMGLLAWRHGARAAGAAVVVLATLQAGTGLWQTAGPLPLGLGVAHNLAAALLLAAVAGLLPSRARA
ncbi:MAG: COX15/CtaA family protein [Ramlibacter sp.]